MAASLFAGLQRRGASKPRTLKALTNTINSIFQKQLTEEDLAAILANLQSQGIVAVDDMKVTYALPPSEDGSNSSP